MTLRTANAAVLSALFLSCCMLGCGRANEPTAELKTEGIPSDSMTAAIVDSTSDSLSTVVTDTALTTSMQTDTTKGKKTMSESTNFYEISTPVGKMVVRLYDETPKHRDNFRKLVKEGYYDGTTFHRVIEGFMIQGGDGNSKDDDPYNDGQGEIDYTIEAEIVPGLIHKRGALAAARQGDQVNPQRRSSGSQFYIVQGTPLSSDQLADMETQLKERDPSFSISPEAAAIYTEAGGTPFLDKQYTVFGELVEGFDVLDAIAATETPRKLGDRTSPALTDRPPKNITMTVRPLPAYAAQ